MYKYCMRTCWQCPGCALFNPTTKINRLVYKFPIDAPFNILHMYGYKAGVHFNFEGTGSYTIAAWCDMAGFAACEPVANKSATTYASAVMKIMLR